MAAIATCISKASKPKACVSFQQQVNRSSSSNSSSSSSPAAVALFRGDTVGDNYMAIGPIVSQGIEQAC